MTKSLANRRGCLTRFGLMHLTKCGCECSIFPMSLASDSRNAEPRVLVAAAAPPRAPPPLFRLLNMRDARASPLMMPGFLAPAAAGAEPPRVPYKETASWRPEACIMLTTATDGRLRFFSTNPATW